MMIFVLTGCSLINSSNNNIPKENLELTLKVNGELYEKMSDLVEDTVVSLPIVSEDNQVFIGWSDGKSTHQLNYTIQKSIQLEAVFEDIDDHFTYSVIEKEVSHATLIDDTIKIDKYIGNDTYLVVPQKIEGKYVSHIASEAFTDSTVVDIHISADVKLEYRAFYNATALESLRYYGELELPYEDTFNHLELADVLSLYPTTCSQDTHDLEVGTYPFGESCPILEISHIESLNIFGQSYTNYSVVLDPMIPKDFKVSWAANIVEGAINLHTIEIPKADTMFLSDALLKAPDITTLIIDEAHPYLKLVDGVLFSHDLSKIIYYPSGKKDTTYSIPEGVTNILGLIENIYIESLNLNDFTGNFIIRGMVGLKEIIVSETNPIYQSIDGVLYEGNTLVSYPANKAGTAFVVPNEIKTIGDYAFYNNQHLETIDLNQVSMIGQSAFGTSKSLSALHLPSTVTYLGLYVIADSSITSLIVHRSDVSDGSITPLLSSAGFNENTLTIYVPDDSLEAYISADYWKVCASFIHPISEYEE
ncbi:MAG: leucine-rich repeat protein [Acholeplasmataceae bacterium]|nr:leucine-rich repeat protein [Acholeplasmataceae bacterium]